MSCIQSTRHDVARRSVLDRAGLRCPLNRDAAGDGVNDGEEDDNNTNPLDRNDF